MQTELTLYLICIWKRASKSKKEIGMVGNSQFRKQRLTASSRIFQQSLTNFGAPPTTKCSFKKYSSLGCVIHIPEKNLCLLGWCNTRHYNPGTSSAKVCGRHTSSQDILKCFYEDADNRMLIHANHAMRVKNFRNVIYCFFRH